MRTRWPLVGRGVELARIVSLLEDPGATGVVLAGHAGVGKSRLADALVGSLDRSRGAVRVRATRATSAVPLGALAPLLDLPAIEEAVDADGLRRALDALVSRAPAGAPLLLEIDDAHALDEASAALVLMLAHSGRAFVIVTVRIGEPCPDAVVALWRDERFERIDLEPFGPTELAEVLTAVLGADIDLGTVHALHQASGGNMLYLRELVHGLVGDGTLHLHDGIWHLTTEVVAPPRLTELVGRALDELSDDELRLVELVALGEPLGVSDVESIGAADVLDGLERRSLLETVLDGRRHVARLSHPMFGEVARERMTTRRRVKLLGDLVGVVESHGLRRRDDARRVAVWRLEAGLPAEPDALLEVARDAMYAADSRAAARYARAALEAGASPVGQYILGIALDDLGDHDGAEVALATYEASVTSDEDLTQAAVARAANLFRGLGRSAEAAAVIDRAEQRIADPVLSDELRSERAIFTSFAGKVAETLALTDPLLDRGDDRAYCQGALPGGIVRVLAGRSGEAIRIATEAFQRRVALGDALHIGEPGKFLVVLAMAQQEHGLLREARDTARAAHEGAAAMFDRNGEAWLATVLARIHLSTGELRAAERLGREAWVIFDELNHPGARWGIGAVALAAAQRGDAEAASAAVAELDARPPTTLTLMDADLDRARAWARAAGGRVTEAVGILARVADEALDADHAALGLAAVHDLARLGDTASAAARVDALGPLVDGELARARVDLVHALAARDVPATLDVAARFDGIGARLYAAEAYALASAQLEREGRRRAATAVARDGDRTLAACDGARTPALAARSHVGPAALTRREREVATLAARGATNRDIAEQLVVSVRTVENHLQRAYEKLGASGRGELADRLRGQ